VQKLAGNIQQLLGSDFHDAPDHFMAQHNWQGFTTPSRDCMKVTTANRATLNLNENLSRLKWRDCDQLKCKRPSRLLKDRNSGLKWPGNGHSVG
jgi:hypothetical protein